MLEKTFYVDMQYNVVPMTKVETFYVLSSGYFIVILSEEKEQSMNME